MNYLLLFELLQFVFNIALGIYVHLTNKDKATNQRIEKITQNVEGRLGEHADRLARLEEGTESSPTHKDLSDLHTRINGLSSEVSSMIGETKSMRHILQLIHQHLLNGGVRQ